MEVLFDPQEEPRGGASYVFLDQAYWTVDPAPGPTSGIFMAAARIFCQEVPILDCAASLDRIAGSLLNDGTRYRVAEVC